LIAFGFEWSLSFENSSKIWFLGRFNWEFGNRFWFCEVGNLEDLNFEIENASSEI
jgi:hypothetical protein